MQQQKKSKIIVISIVILLIGYGINQLFQSKKQKDQIYKYGGRCAPPTLQCGDLFVL